MNREIYEMKKNIDKINSTNIHAFLLENENLSQEDLDFFCKQIALRHDGYYIYWTAKKVKRANIAILQEGLIGCDKMEYVEAFIEDIEGFSYEKLYSDLINSKNPSALIELHQTINGLDIKKIQNIGIKMKDDAVFLYLLSLNNTDKDKIFKAIIESECKEAMFAVALLYGDKVEVIRLIEDRFIELKDANYIADLAIHIENSNKEKLYDAILNIYNPDAWINFARDIENIDIKRVEDKLVAIKNIVMIVRFAKEVKGANVSRLEDIVVKSRDIKSMVDFLDVDGVNRDKILQAIVDTKDEFCIENVAVELTDNDYKILMKKYKKLIGRKRIKRAKVWIEDERRIFKESIAIIEEMVEQIININNKKK